KALGGRDIVQAARRDGELADVLDQGERRPALVGSDRVAEDAAQEPDVLAQARVFFEPVVHFRYHSGSRPQRSPASIPEEESCPVMSASPSPRFSHWSRSQAAHPPSIRRAP